MVRVEPAQPALIGKLFFLRPETVQKWRTVISNELCVRAGKFEQ